jgi:hypothetical protein
MQSSVNSEFGIRNSECPFLGNERQRAVAVPFLTFFEARAFLSAQHLWQTMSKVAPHGNRVLNVEPD